MVGWLVETSRDMWNVHCSFRPGPGFAAVAELFAEKALLAEWLLEAEDEASLARFDELEEATSPPVLTLEQGDALVEFGLLYVEGEQAGFRLA